MGESIVLGMVLFVSQGASVASRSEDHMRTFRLHNSRFTTLRSNYHFRCRIFPPLEVACSTLKHIKDNCLDGLPASSYYEALAPYENTNPIWAKLCRYNSGLVNQEVNLDHDEYVHQIMSLLISYYRIIARQSFVFVWSEKLLATVYKQLWNEDFEVNSVPCAEQLKNRIMLTGKDFNAGNLRPLRLNLSSILEAATILRENRLPKAAANFEAFLQTVCCTDGKCATRTAYTPNSETQGPSETITGMKRMILEVLEILFKQTFSAQELTFSDDFKRWHALFV